MLDCTDARELLGLYLDNELEEELVPEVREHLARCAECSELLETMEQISLDGASLADLAPPEHLAGHLSASPCSRWLGLLFQAVDREISQGNLERLISHLEACPACRRAWQDLTLIHQVSEAMVPAPHLLKRCIAAPERKERQRPLLNRRLATAAAYLLAVLTSLIIGNPVTLARGQASVEKVAQAVSAEVGEVAEHGRGEARIILWRVWKWGENTIETVRDFFRDDSKEEDSAPEQGETS